MSQESLPFGSSVVAVYPDHESAERAIQLLHKNGFAIEDLSIVGHNIQMTEEPTGFITTGDYVSAGARSGALIGGLAGVALGAALLVIPGIGPIIVAGPIAAAVLAGVEGAVAGFTMGAIAGALVAWGVPKEHAVKFESEVHGGKFLVLTRGTPEQIDRAQALLKADTLHQIVVYDHTKA
jgi:uncharacterized membrane protein